MTEREVFLGALDIADRDERLRFLDGACAGDTTLRASVDELLAAHEKSGRFLSVPDDPSRTLDTNETSELGFLEPSDKPGSIGRLGHYEILGVLGRGGFGIVLKAFDETLHRVVAIKAMAMHLAATSPPRKRFLGEARAVAAIKHENVVAVFAVEEKPVPYLVMEFVAGETLQQHIDRTGPLDLAEVVGIARQIARGLEAAHATGLIHRDIKPANILLEAGPELKVKITDFGLARAADDARLTQSGAICGTPMYMSPEQAQGQPLDARSDLFSLGSVMYVMASGRPPFRAESTLAVMKRLVEETPRPIREIVPSVPEWLCGVIDTLQAKRPADRYASAKDVVDAIDRTRQPSPPPRGLSKKWLLGGMAAAVALLVGFIVWRSTRANDPLPAEPDVARREPTPALTPTPTPEPPKPTADRKPRHRTGGDWKIENGELVQSKPQTSMLLFGDPAWTDYVFEAEAQSTLGVKGSQGPMFHYRVQDPSNFGEFVIGAYGGFATEATFHKAGAWGRVPGCFIPTPHEHGRWYRVRIEAIGSSVNCSVDGKPVFNFEGHVPTRGMIGVATWNSAIRYRNFKVTAPDGKTLWEGFPELGMPSPQPSDRRAAEWVLSNGGRLQIAPGGNVDELEKLPKDDYRIVVVSFGGAIGVDDAAKLNSLPQAAALYFRQSTLTNEGLAQLTNCPNVKVLSLDSTKVTDAGMPALLHFSKLTELGLHNTRITDAAIEHIRKIKTLTTLDLSLTGVSDEGLKSLQVLENLQSLQVYQSKVSPEGVKAFAKARPQCKIRWDGETIEPQTAPADPDRRAAEFILRFPRDHGIQIQINDVDRWIGKVEDLPKSPFKLTGLHVEWSKTLDDAALANFAGCKHLKTLKIWGAPVTEKGLIHFAGCRDLETLEFSTDTVKDAALKVFEPCTRADLKYS